MNWYEIDKENSDNEYLYIDLKGIGTVVIKKEYEGIAIDVFPLHVVDEPVASTYAFYTELTAEGEK